MVQSPSWEVNWFAASQEIPRISRNPKVHYRTHKRPPPISILGQPNPVHIPTSHLLEIHPNIIHPSTPSSLQWSLSLRFPHQDPIHPLSSPIRATCPAHLILLEFLLKRKDQPPTPARSKIFFSVVFIPDLVSVTSPIQCVPVDTFLWIKAAGEWSRQLIPI